MKRKIVLLVVLAGCLSCTGSQVKPNVSLSDVLNGLCLAAQAFDLGHFTDKSYAPLVCAVPHVFASTPGTKVSTTSAVQAAKELCEAAKAVDAKAVSSQKYAAEICGRVDQLADLLPDASQ